MFHPLLPCLLHPQGLLHSLLLLHEDTGGLLVPLLPALLQHLLLQPKGLLHSLPPLHPLLHAAAQQLSPPAPGLLLEQGHQGTQP